jgi:hypothetical protein
MSYRQYTQCIDIANFNNSDPRVQAALLGLYITLTPAAFSALLVIAGAASPLCLIILAEIYLIASIVGYCYCWLYRRLICLPDIPQRPPADSAGDHMVIGTLIDILPPSARTSVFDVDNDYSIGILPQCSPIGAGLDEVANNPRYGYLVAKHPIITAAGLPFRPILGTDHEFPDNPVLEKKSETLHCEFEGRGVYDMYLASRVSLLVAVAALFVCMIPDIGWIVALILFVLALIGIGIGYVVGQFDNADQNDVTPNIGEFVRNDASHQGADTLVVRGHWVYDSGHNYDHTPPDGYNELHPITFCTRTSPECGGVIFLARWNAAIDNATSPFTLENQKLPQNQWQVHPLLDGCQPVVIV